MVQRSKYLMDVHENSSGESTHPWGASLLTLWCSPACQEVCDQLTGVARVGLLRDYTDYGYPSQTFYFFVSANVSLSPLSLTASIFTFTVIQSIHEQQRHYEEKWFSTPTGSFLSSVHNKITYPSIGQRQLRRHRKEKWESKIQCHFRQLERWSHIRNGRMKAK